jgi:hypothetical protein
MVKQGDKYSMRTLTPRQKLILETLQQNQQLSVQDIQEQFRISQPTAYREIRELVEMDLAKRVRGGIRLGPPPPHPPQESACTHCQKPVYPRTAFVIQLESGQQPATCCPHCGLMALTHQDGVQSAMATDYLYGNMVNIRQATFLVDSQVVLCCMPSVLCFANLEDARRFQKGFGGNRMDFKQALEYIRQKMTLNIEKDL